MFFARVVEMEHTENDAGAHRSSCLQRDFCQNETLTEWILFASLHVSFSNNFVVFLFFLCAIASTWRAGDEDEKKTLETRQIWF